MRLGPVVLVFALSACHTAVAPSDAGSPDDGGASCALVPTTEATLQTRARVGAYYFDGWTGPATRMHFMGLLDGGYADREPVTGWYDSDPCVVEQQLAWARSFGIDFFVFDWYFNVLVNADGENLNSAFDITRQLSNRHGMQYGMLYANGPGFEAGPADWPSLVDQWVSYFSDADYVRVDGKPLLVVLDPRSAENAFGSPAAMATAFGQLRAAAQAEGLPGVYIAANLILPDGISGQDARFPDFTWLSADGYDATTMYGYPFVPPAVNGAVPFAVLTDAGSWIWGQQALKSALPFIPSVMDGWDPRPWNEREFNTGDLMWFTRTPSDVTAAVSAAITWAESSPRLRAEPSPLPPLVLLEAWNEMGEGSYLVPTLGDGATYGDALGALLTTPSGKLRSVLTLADNGNAAPSRQATGTLADEHGVAIGGATVVLAATAVDGAGYYGQYQVSGTVPGGASQAVVGFRVNGDGAGPSPSDFSLYQASYQGADGVERVANGDFSDGATSWLLQGQAELARSDRGQGFMVVVEATASESARLDSAAFSVVPGDTFVATFSARVAPSSVGSGWFDLIFLDVSSGYLSIPLAPSHTLVGTAATDAAGAYALSLDGLAGANAILEASYAGSAGAWPAYARVGGP